MPFELAGLKPFVFVGENETKLLICDKLQLNLIKDFSVVIKEIIKYCATTKDSIKVHALGKWLLLNCSSFFVANNTNNKIVNQELVELVRHAKLFLNQNQELCAANQFLNPLFKERFLAILDPKWLPYKDLVVEEKCINVLKELKMRNCLQLKVDEIIDLYEHSIKQNDNYRRLFAELVIDILVNRLQDVSNTTTMNGGKAGEAVEKILNEYSTTKAVTLKHFLMSVNWIPLQRERPQSYPQSLFWKGAEMLSSSNNGPGNMTNGNLTNGGTTNGGMSIRFSSPRDCVDSQFGYCAGSVACVSDLEIPPELKTHIDLKQVNAYEIFFLSYRKISLIVPTLSSRFFILKFTFKGGTLTDAIFFSKNKKAHFDQYLKISILLIFFLDFVSTKASFNTRIKVIVQNAKKLCFLSFFLNLAMEHYLRLR